MPLALNNQECYRKAEWKSQQITLSKLNNKDANHEWSWLFLMLCIRYVLTLTYNRDEKKSIAQSCITIYFFFALYVFYSRCTIRFFLFCSFVFVTCFMQFPLLISSQFSWSFTSIVRCTLRYLCVHVMLVRLLSLCILER